MKKTIVNHPEIKLIGLKVRTRNSKEFNPETAKIGALVGRYWQENIAQKIPNRKNPGVSLVGYSNYESDEHGDYDYYYGEEVTSLDEIPSELSGLLIPAGQFIKVTSEEGPSPQIIIDTWQKVWQMTADDQLGAKRGYFADFEVYDQRASNPANMVFDIYLRTK